MGFIVFEEEAFNYLDAQLENFVKRMDRIRERSEDKTMNKWLDNRVGGKRSSFSPTFVFRPLTPPYMRFRIRRFLFWVPFDI